MIKLKLGKKKLNNGLYKNMKKNLVHKNKFQKKKKQFYRRNLRGNFLFLTFL